MQCENYPAWEKGGLEYPGIGAKSDPFGRGELCSQATERYRSIAELQAESNQFRTQVDLWEENMRLKRQPKPPCN
jgi:hypothetical protein